jgi:uncharacterized membrane protein YsdA (DUF1294 family)
VNLSFVQQTLALWIAGTSVLTFGLFCYDKWRAGRGARRISEATLCTVSACGGWPGGLLGIVLFRHKSAKPRFLLKFAQSFLIWAGLIWLALRLGGPA